MNDADRVVENELALQRPSVRADPSAVRALLDPSFTEVIATGEIFDCETVIEVLATHRTFIQPKFLDAKTVRLAPDVLLLTYTDGSTYHSSVWVLASTGAWRLHFHQQTPIIDVDPAES
jgi:hypothetical protein